MGQIHAPDRAVAIVAAGGLVALNDGELRPVDAAQRSGLSTATRLTNTFVPTARPPVA